MALPEYKLATLRCAAELACQTKSAQSWRFVYQSKLRKELQYSMQNLRSCAWLSYASCLASIEVSHPQSVETRRICRSKQVPNSNDEGDSDD
eukprot:4394574-Amphidinium_carterae.2